MYCIITTYVHQNIICVCKCVLSWCEYYGVCLYSLVKRGPNPHNRHQPPFDGRLCRTFHEASYRFVSPTRD